LQLRVYGLAFQIIIPARALQVNDHDVLYRKYLRCYLLDVPILQP